MHKRRGIGARQREIGTTKHQVRIVDVPRLQTVLWSFWKRRPGTQWQAAEALEIGRWTFTRLLRGTLKCISLDTHQNMRGGLRRANTPPELELEHDFDLSFWTKDGWLVQQHYQSWLQEEIRRLEPQVQTVFYELYEDQRYQEIFEAFLTSVTRHPELPPSADHNGYLSTDAQRVWLALYRAIERLVAANVTWGVKPSWRELHDAKKLRSCLHAVLRCERIMLKEDPYFERVNKCSPPSSYLDVLTGEARKQEQN